MLLLHEFLNSDPFSLLTSHALLLFNKDLSLFHDIAADWKYDKDVSTSAFAHRLGGFSDKKQ